MKKEAVIQIVEQYLNFGGKDSPYSLAQLCGNDLETKKTLFPEFRRDVCRVLPEFSKKILKIDDNNAYLRIMEKYKQMHSYLENGIVDNGVVRDFDMVDFCQLFHEDRHYFQILRSKGLLEDFDVLRGHESFSRYIPYYDDMKNSSQIIYLNRYEVLRGRYILEDGEITLEEKESFLAFANTYHVLLYKKMFYYYVKKLREEKNLGIRRIREI